MAEASGQPDVVVRPVEAETVACLPGPPTADLETAFYELEAVVRDLGIRARRPPGALAERGGATAFVPIRRTVVDPRIACRRLPAVRAATVVHHGSYATISATRRALERWIDAARFTPVGPLRVLYLQFGGEPELRLPADYLVERSSEFVTEIQLPVADLGHGTFSPGRDAPR